MTLSHPKGMYVLAFTEIFERLSFFTLSFLLVLYASAPLTEKGLGWSKTEALTLGGIYTMAVYIFPIIGSFIADRFELITGQLPAINQTNPTRDERSEILDYCVDRLYDTAFSLETDKCVELDNLINFCIDAFG